MEDALLAHGPLGIAVLGLSVAVVALWRRNEALHDKREADVKVITDALHASATATGRHADVLEEFANRLPHWIRNGRR